ncbi:MAG: ATP-binding protein [Gammaproteobacteria bacterium]|nr:ATP-binding protein [Gammaproteobacteria bacterium]
MKINKHSLLLIIILSVIVFIVMGLTLSTLYNAAFEQQRAQLTAITQSQARLIESVARFDELFSKNDVEGGAAIATLNQIKDAHLNNQGFGKSGEFLFGKKENNKIIFLIPRRFKGILEAEGQNGLLDVGGTYAEPIQLALAGKSGNVIARDYRGVLVLAAYAPVNILNHGYGVVAKIDMQEIREPFIRVGLISVLVAVILIFIGAVLFLRITNPIIKRMEGSAKRLNEAQRLAKVGSWELNLLNGKLIWSDEIFHIFDIDKNKFDASYDAFLNAIHPDDREAVNKAYTDSLTDRKPYEIVHRLKMEDGEIKYVRETCESSFDENNKPIRSVGTVQDITELYIVESELEKHRKHLEELVEERTRDLHDVQDELVRKERLATLGQLTATVSHELRNPLGAMRPSLYVIEKRSDKEDERLQNAIARVDRNINRCDRIIDELLDFTRITNLNLKPTRVDEWLEGVIDEQFIPEGIQVNKEFDLKDILYDIDSDRLQRVIINVFENACHSMMDDNQRLVNTKNSHVNIKAKTNSERLEIIITDTGTGIPKDILDKIFEPLFSTKGFGVGLGMPTVKQIMEQHFGGIEIESEENKGTSVTLWLPMSTSKEKNKGVMA